MVELKECCQAARKQAVRDCKAVMKKWVAQRKGRFSQGELDLLTEITDWVTEELTNDKAKPLNEILTNIIKRVRGERNIPHASYSRMHHRHSRR